MLRRKVLILGAAGRDFHDFNLAFRDEPGVEVVAFTAAQIPDIAGRRYPTALAGPLYPDGIPILPEGELERLVAGHAVDEIVLAYSDLAHEAVMHLASRALASGAGFRLLGPRATMLRATKPVVSVCAVRTGCGKSPAARHLAALLRAAGCRVAVVRHPMPYGDLAAQAVQHFATLADLEHARCTVEEREEYEPHLAAGDAVFAGVDYARVLEQAQAHGDVILWDGGNNDLPFFEPDLEIVLADPHRLGDERRYFPGEVNLLRADVVVLSKVDTAPEGSVAALRKSVQTANPGAQIVEAALPASLENPDRIVGARVLVIEDGPTLTHGGMAYGAGTLAARRLGARELVDPRRFAAGSLVQTFADYPHIGALLPAMGYGPAQLRDLAETIARTPCDVVLLASPVDLRRVIPIAQPVSRLTYRFEQTTGVPLRDLLALVLAKAQDR